MFRTLLQEKSIEELREMHGRSERMLQMAYDKKMWGAVARKANDLAEITSVLQSKLI